MITELTLEEFTNYWNNRTNLGDYPRPREKNRYSKKRFKKLLMSVGNDRNTSNELANDPKIERTQATLDYYRVYKISLSRCFTLDEDYVKCPEDLFVDYSKLIGEAIKKNGEEN